MTRDVEAAVLVLVGVFMGRVVVEGRYLSYVKAGLFVPLVVAAVLLIVVGLLSARSRHPEETPSLSGHPHVGDVLAPLASDDHGHGHHGPGRVGYLLLVPVAVLVLIAPSPLGAYAADLGSANRSVEDQAASFEWPDLPEAVGGASDVTLAAVLTRAISPGNTKLVDAPVRMVGFVVADDELDDGYRLTRFTLGCCAADAAPLSVRIVAVDQIPPDDTWLEVTAVYRGQIDGEGFERLPVLEFVSATEIAEPAQPYE